MLLRNRKDRAPVGVPQPPSCQASSRSLAASSAAAAAGSPPLRAVRIDDSPRRRDQAASRARGERCRKILHPASLGPDPREQEYRRRHQLAQLLQTLWRGGPDDRGDVAQARGPDAGTPELGDQSRDPVADDSASLHRNLLDVGRSGVRGPGQHEQAAAALAGGVDERLQRVGPEQRVDGERVGADPVNGPVDGGRGSQERLRVGPSGDVDVAALAVGDDDQPGVVAAIDRLLQRGPAGSAEPFEAGDLWLDCGAVGAGRLDRQGAVRGYRAADPDRDRVAAAGRVGELDRLGPQLRWIWIEPEHELGGPRRDLGCDAVSEALNGRRLALY